METISPAIADVLERLAAIGTAQTVLNLDTRLFPPGRVSEFASRHRPLVMADQAGHVTVAPAGPQAATAFRCLVSDLLSAALAGE